MLGYESHNTIILLGAGPGWQHSRNIANAADAWMLHKDGPIRLAGRGRLSRKACYMPHGIWSAAFRFTGRRCGATTYHLPHLEILPIETI